ncbi:MAG TPA: hypothetical protein VI248_04235 [Kineosporiaceae bacterium]
MHLIAVRNRRVRRIPAGRRLVNLLLRAVACLVATVSVGVILADTLRATAPADAAARAPAVHARAGAAGGAASPAELVREVNKLRVRAGCAAATGNAALQRAARGYVLVASDAGGVAHVDGVGGTAQDRARRQGYRGSVIELVAEGSLQPDEFGAALPQLVNQSDLLDCRFRSVGAAVANRHLVIVLGDL